MKVIEDKIEKLIVQIGNDKEPYIYTINGYVQKGSSSDDYKITKIQQLFIEVKTPKGRPSKEQLNFIERAKHDGCIAGICRSADDAIKLIKFQED